MIVVIMSDDARNITHWDVYPKSIRLSITEHEQKIPLSVRGIDGVPIFKSSNPLIADVDEFGYLSCGLKKGNAMIMAYDSDARQSLRYVNVEVRDTAWFAEHPDFSVDLGAMVNVTGSVVDALTTQGISGVLVSIRRTAGGPIVAQQVTNNFGQYEIILYEGTYVYTASAANYIDSNGNLHVNESQTTGQNIVLSPELIGQVARIVLQWGQNPRDLDSHLWGPKAGGRFHVYYSNDIETDAAELDVDDTSSYGPETITIHQFIPGIYRYSVHDYTNRNRTESMGLAQSGATVKLFYHDDREYTFEVPDLLGTAWNVFEIDGATGEVMSVNTMEYVKIPEEVGG